MAERPVCGQLEGRCRCIEAPHEDGPHRCECGGSWHYADGDDVVIDAYPGSAPDWPGPDSRDADWFDLLMAGPPIRAQRGPIRFVWPPELSVEKERRMIEDLRSPDA